MKLKDTFFKKTLFKQYLTITMLILITSFLVLGSMLMMFITSYWEDEKHQLLDTNAKAIAELVSNNSKVANNNIFIIDNSLMQGFVSIFSSNINADIFVTNSRGEILLCSEGNRCDHLSGNVSEDIVSQALKGGYNATTTLGVYDHDCYVVASPVFMNTKDGLVPLGVVFTATDAGYISVFRNDVLTMLIFASLLAFGISFFVIWMLSYSLVKPLSEMSRASKKFGTGDFSERVPVKRTDEIGQLATAFNNMADSLSKSEDTRRNFIANVSHELKTPMTTISGFVDGILDGTIPKDRQVHYLNIVSSETKRLSRLVKLMLNLSRIDSGALKLTPSKFDLSKTVLNALLSLESKIEEKGIEIRGIEDAKPIFVEADQDMMHQVIYNLIENAVKFTDNGGYIEVSTFCKQKEAHFYVKNSGPGISQNDLRFIFEKFYKTDKSRSQDKNGMGLGLYIVKTIIKLHNGEITANSIQGEYTLFEFYIPYKG